MKQLLVAFFLTVSSVLAQADSRGLPDFTELVERQGPAVVNISTTQSVRSSGRNAQPFPFDESDPMYEFFRRFIPRQPGIPGVPRDYESRSLGSGFVISTDGYLLTNAHVVDSADEILVRLTDKREFKARVIGTDKRTDVALIKIEATGLPTVRLGDPGGLKVGEWVIAIGSPFGFENSVTAGIVSAKGRSLPQENYVPFIQTDTAVNPGNSGGPLFNMKGEVVGINSQIYSRSGGFMGISFAIPIDVAMEIQAQLRANGRVSRGRIGVVIQEVTKELAESFGLSKAQGAAVNAVEKGGPAEKAGIEAGDVILRFDGKTIGSSSDLPRIVGSTKPGSRVTIQIWRKGAIRDVSVVIGEIAEEKVASRSSRSAKSPDRTANRLGLVVSELTAEQKRELKVNGGLLIEDVRNNAARVDLRPGDVILALITRGENIEIKSSDQFNRLLAQFDKSANVTLLVRRGELQTFVTIKGLTERRGE
ncbi:MAG TPA: DegQ family serine endoprotease [Accumulibacter sp.]|uniref:Probable periplasmic serine endoprotease DegP-like n=2 Tax=Candidatus Accumulibacter TaxID=327159 RepID=A0A7D5SMD6_9PROT|nr:MULTISPECIES: DegQ family serine endoprotease [Candidatus Accumulibacter]QLH49583.1 MAG: DegQ family serine endoprotease [Candidatus Accumulibacter cognatus]MBL8400654.1 DegQ family serine endoprotease [Accumulibacter sp.]MBN8516985.1 DegQ family serine endoprotease [Accumulibacter sp.]MBO3711558.1 DegQ family serine endoprotease [Accumulibacter sp.]MCC2867672.1 DegQ family serine endoprotease [Candidatus Accumulibacter phosphatis]